MFSTTVTATNATTLTLSFNGLAANTLPITDGQAVTCSGCASGLFVVSVDHPPTQDTRAGQGQIGFRWNNFIVTLNAAPGVGTGHAFTFRCSGTAGAGSNCILIPYTIPTTGTYGTPASLGTCGENNANGNAPSNGNPGNGVCQSNGVGSLVRNFAIGSNQAIWGGGGPVGGHSYYDDGMEPGGAHGFNQSAAFTCHIASPKVVQCILGPTYTAGIPAIGRWSSGGTYVEQGDNFVGNSRIDTLMGYVGGQSFPITSPGSGQTPGAYTFQPPNTAATSSTYTSSAEAYFRMMALRVAPPGPAIGSTINGTGVTVQQMLPSGSLHRNPGCHRPGDPLDRLDGEQRHRC